MALLDSGGRRSRRTRIPRPARLPVRSVRRHRPDVLRGLPRRRGRHQEVVLKGGRDPRVELRVPKQLDVFLARPNAMWLCVRRFANTLRRCYANVLWAIRNGMTIGRPATRISRHRCRPLEVVYNATGQKILFSGLDDPEKLKSITFDDPRKKIEILTWEEYTVHSSHVHRAGAGATTASSSLFSLPDSGTGPTARPPTGGRPRRPRAPLHLARRARGVPGRAFVANERMYRKEPRGGEERADGECIELRPRLPQRRGADHRRRGVAGPGDPARPDWAGTDPGCSSARYDRKRRELVIYGDGPPAPAPCRGGCRQEHLAERGSDRRPIRRGRRARVPCDLPWQLLRHRGAQASRTTAPTASTPWARRNASPSRAASWLRGARHRDQPTARPSPGVCRLRLLNKEAARLPNPDNTLSRLRGVDIIADPDTP
ncbi:MAG: phage terminase large subunit [Eggerthellaceae bacterium]